MASLFPVSFCAVSSVDPSGSVRLSCLDASTLAPTPIIVSSVQGADQILSSTFLWLAVIATSSLLPLLLLRKLRASGLFAGKRKALGKTESLGSRWIVEGAAPYVPGREDW